jgi:uncharacterized protein (TIGR01777 family)
MRVLITGATGLVGDELVSLFLKSGISVHYLTTSKQKITSRLNCNGYFWDPQQCMIDENALIGVDTIIHLAGATISKRWTDSYKQEIVESRIFSANVLFKTLKKNPHQVKQIISASAIGIYPDSLANVYHEDAAQKDVGFLGHVVEKWEASIDKFQLLGLKVCKIRTGLVLSEKGGALPVMAKPIKSGLGAAFGSGKQFQSWIHLDDLARIYLFAAKQSLEGVYNATAPNPITNTHLTKAIARVLDKPLFMPNIPRFFMKLVLGEMHELLFSSQNVNSEKIQKAGFQFKHETIEKALNEIYKK